MDQISAPRFFFGFGCFEVSRTGNGNGCIDRSSSDPSCMDALFASFILGWGKRFMLILTRKSGEAIRIGDEVTLKIIEIRGNQVRLGVEAPRDLAVHREEIYSLIRNETSWTTEIKEKVGSPLPTIGEETSP